MSVNMAAPTPPYSILSNHSLRLPRPRDPRHGCDRRSCQEYVGRPSHRPENRGNKVSMNVAAGNECEAYVREKWEQNY